ncbi:MAG: hypothetical protein ACRELW_04910 [Candidatus Rokuibacteriota bacterium]
MTSNRWIAALLALLLIGTLAPVSWAEDTSQAKREPSPGATAAAVVSDVFYVPGKAIVCGVSGVLWIGTMALTFGALYQEAADFVKGGCGGRWVLTGEDIKPAKSY